MIEATSTLPAFNIPGKGLVIKVDNVFWVYLAFQDDPKSLYYQFATEDLVKAILFIEDPLGGGL